MKNLLNLYLSLYPLEYQRRSNLFYWTSVFLFLFWVLSSVTFGIFLYEDGSSLPRIYFIALFGMLLSGFLQNFAMGLDADAFGEKMRGYGGSVWKLARILTSVIGYPSLVVMGYVLIGQLADSGESVTALTVLFGAGILGLVIWSFSDMRKRYLRLREGEISRE